MSPTKAKLTFEEYLAYDDGTDKRYELEDGALVEMPPATVGLIYSKRRKFKHIEKAIDTNTLRLEP